MESIRIRLSVYLVAAAIFTALALGLITYRQTLRQNEELFDYQLRQMALSLRDQGFVANPQSLYGLEEEVPEVVVQIWTRNGAIVYLSHPGSPLPDRATLGFSDIEAGNRLWRVYGTIARDRIIQVAQPVQLRRDLAAAAAFRSLAPLLAFAPIMALLIWLLVDSSLSAVERVARDVAKRDARVLDAISEEGVPSEIAPLVGSLNSLLVRLRRAFASQRAFVADAAHELRSPLTALKLQLQLLGRAPDENARTQALAKLNEGVDRATHLIEQLLTAARTDPNDTSAALRQTDLAELTRQAIADVFPFAQSRHIGIEFDAPDHAMLLADPGSLRVLVRNLLDNAIRYTPERGAVHAAIAADDVQLALVIEDSGPGIPEEERERVFDRFYRREQGYTGGSGLGLAIVRNIAEQHGADVKLDASPLGGLKVSILFARAMNTTPPAA
ncbi:ATP-binding protein [Noviherbaspirillum massiliense]|uniref:ATP-binding protein n=1 Tax=Noviherbaspirillum massiliense TaxID=1465823 RepID=UPI000307FF8D|nr:ATP-binding protein [Noviherbaspirillum massiliense]